LIPEDVRRPLAGGTKSGDGQSSRAYLPPDDLMLALQVALATGRPLLLRGEPGSGKSSFGPFAAWALGWRYYEEVVTNGSKSRELQYRYDPIGRLSLANRGKDRGPVRFVEPGPLWWAIAPQSACRFGSSRRRLQELGGGAVVLIDEIDKADPDYPNDLLVPLGARRFSVPELGITIGADAGAHNVLVIITTNDERELPAPFIRRCVVFGIEHPETVEGLVRIANQHVEAGHLDPDQNHLFSDMAQKLLDLREQAKSLGVRKPSTSEYLDILRTFQALKFQSETNEWKEAERLVLRKWESESRP
jgi:MoxR-like ATPase